MAKKDKKKAGGNKENEPSPVPSSSPISKKGWKIIGVGVLIAVFGFIVLSFTDPSGKNFASQLSPFLILGGYAVIGFGIVAKERSSQVQ